MHDQRDRAWRARSRIYSRALACATRRLARAHARARGAIARSRVRARARGQWKSRREAFAQRDRRCLLLADLLGFDFKGAISRKTSETFGVTGRSRHSPSQKRDATRRDNILWSIEEIGRGFENSWFRQNYLTAVSIYILLHGEREFFTFFVKRIR